MKVPAIMRSTPRNAIVRRRELATGRRRAALVTECRLALRRTVLRLLMLTPAAVLPCGPMAVSYMTLWYPAVAGGDDEGSDQGRYRAERDLLDASSGCRVGPADLLKRG
jgi:hypothetical protein